MSVDRWNLRVTLAAGMSTSGKTTFLLRYLVTQFSACQCIYIYDPLGRMAHTLGLVCATSLQDLEDDAADGWVCFDPQPMFPGDNKAGLEFFARWSYDRAVAMPGRKALLVDEVWKYQSAQSIPQPLAEWVQDGAKFGCECLFATQVPNKLNSAITAHVTELVCFYLQERNALDFAEAFSLDRAEVASLPLGSFVARNLLSRGEIRARLW